MSAPALPDPLNLKLNPTGYLSAAGAVYAAAAMIYNAHYHHGVISTPVILAALGAVAGVLIHQVVTPVAAPKDGNGNPLVTAPVHPDPGPVPLVRPVPPYVLPDEPPYAAPGDEVPPVPSG